MKWENLEKIHQAPEQGMLLLYLRTEVVFHAYSSIQQVKDEVDDRDMLEMHLFNDQKEYRAVTSESPRFDNGCVEWVADFDTKGCFSDETVREEDGSKIIIANHISYNETGMAAIDDYRLIMGKG